MNLPGLQIRILLQVTKRQVVRVELRFCTGGEDGDDTRGEGRFQEQGQELRDGAHAGVVHQRHGDVESFLGIYLTSESRLASPFHPPPLEDTYLSSARIQPPPGSTSSSQSSAPFPPAPLRSPPAR